VSSNDENEETEKDAKKAAGKDLPN
jgi:hypothetical protein